MRTPKKRRNPLSAAYGHGQTPYTAPSLFNPIHANFFLTLRCLYAKEPFSERGRVNAAFCRFGAIPR